MALSPKRYIGTRVGQGVLATGADVDHGFVDAPLLNSGLYRAQRLADGTYGVGPCHLPERKPGITVNAGVTGVVKCGLKYVGFSVLLSPEYNSGLQAVYAGDSPWKCGRANVLRKIGASGGPWPEFLELIPLAGGNSVGGWARSWPCQETANDWQFTIAGMNDPSLDGEHVLKCGIGYENCQIGGYVANLGNLWNGGSFISPHNRITRIPGFIVRIAPRSQYELILSIDGYNSFGDVCSYSTNIVFYPSLWPITKTLDKGGLSALWIDPAPAGWHDNWPDRIELTVNSDFATFSLSNMIDQAINGTHILEQIGTTWQLTWASPGPYLVGHFQLILM